jgi:hypothetical protein
MRLSVCNRVESSMDGKTVHLCCFCDATDFFPLHVCRRRATVRRRDRKRSVCNAARRQQSTAFAFGFVTTLDGLK